MQRRPSKWEDVLELPDDLLGELENSLGLRFNLGMQHCSLGLNVKRWRLDLETDHWYQRNIWLWSTTCHEDALKGYSHKPDCFKRAANKILGRCEELDMDENTRVNGFRIPFFFLITNHSRCHHDVSCDLHDLVRGCNRNTLFHPIRVYGLY